MKNGPVGAALFHADRRTDEQTGGKTEGQVQRDMTKLIVAFRIFANAPKKKV